MAPSSPFDDPSTEVVDRTGSDYPDRPRRPWWRWNVIPLFFVLFVVVWIRSLANWSPGFTWLVVGSILALWIFVPILFLPSVWTTMAMPEPPTPSANRSMRPKFNNGPLVVCKILAVLFGLFSCVHFLVVILTLINSAPQLFNQIGGGRNATYFQMQLVTALIQPMMELMAAASLYVLAEIGMRLGNSRQD